MKLILFFVLITAVNYSFSQNNPGAKQIAMSNSDVALSNDVFSIFNNPAGLAQMNWREIGVYYSPAPFGFTELANGFVAYNEPFSFGNLTIGGMNYGFDLYKENKIVIGYSYNYLNTIFAGVAFNYHTVSIQRYGNDASFYLDVGALVYLNNNLRWGFSWHNINRATFGTEKDQIPTIFNSGFSYDLLSNFSINLAVEKELKYNASFRFGIEYDIIKYLTIRTGFSNEPSRYSTGIGINYSNFSLDYAMFTNQDLGLTHQAGIVFSFGDDGSRKDKIRKYLNQTE